MIRPPFKWDVGYMVEKRWFEWRTNQIIIPQVKLRHFGHGRIRTDRIMAHLFCMLFGVESIENPCSEMYWWLRVYQFYPKAKGFPTVWAYTDLTWIELIWICEISCPYLSTTFLSRTWVPFAFPEATSLFSVIIIGQSYHTLNMGSILSEVFENLQWLSVQWK